MLLPNNTLLQGGKYKVVRHISSGGFGNTYEGVHCLMNTRVAIKEFFVKDFCNRDQSSLSISVATQSKVELVEKLREKFFKEAKSIFQMSHKNIVRVTDIFDENDTSYYVMDYIDGMSLSDLVRQRGKLTEAEALGYIRQAAEGLKYVHSLNRLHLDIKPQNLMLTKNGELKIIDFGASKHYDAVSGENTSTLMGVNTKGYAPIEQTTSGFTSFSPATDIYALGATLYKLLTGVTPPDSALIAAGAANLAPIPPTVSAATQNAVQSAMRIQRGARPQSIDEFMALIGGAAPSAGVNDSENTMIDAPVAHVNPQPRPQYVSQPQYQPQPQYPQAPENNNNKLKIALAAAVIIAAVLLGSVIAMVNKKDPAPEVAEATEAVEQPDGYTAATDSCEAEEAVVDEPAPAPEPVFDFFDGRSHSFVGTAGGAGISGTLTASGGEIYGSYAYNNIVAQYGNSPQTRISLNGNYEGSYIGVDAYNYDGDYCENWNGYVTGRTFSGNFDRSDGRQMSISIQFTN